MIIIIGIFVVLFDYLVFNPCIIMFVYYKLSYIVKLISWWTEWRWWVIIVWACFTLNRSILFGLCYLTQLKSNSVDHHRSRYKDIQTYILERLTNESEREYFTFQDIGRLLQKGVCGIVYCYLYYQNGYTKPSLPLPV